MCAGIFSFSWFTYWAVRRNMVKETQSSMHELSLRVMDQIDYWYSERLANLAGWATEKVFVSSTEDSFIGEAARKSAILEVQQVGGTNLYFETLWVALPNGQVIVSSDLEDIGTLNVAKCAYFQAALNGRTGVSEVMAEKSFGLPVFVIAVPIKKNEAIVGVLMGTVDLKRFSKKFILPVNQEKGGLAFLCRQDGMLIAHPDKTLLLNENIASTSWSREFLSGAKKTLECTVNGTPSLVAHCQHPETGWHLGIITPMDTGRAGWLAIVAGLLFAVGLVATMGLILHRNKELEETVSERTLSLRKSEEQLAATLRSIGDGVIACDAEGRIVSLNASAEKLTGWHGNESQGHPIAEVFNIINVQTRLPAEIPVFRSMSENCILDLANHTALIARDGSEIQISDSCAPIHDSAGNVVGAVLVFRDATHEYQQRHSEMQMRLQSSALEAAANAIVITDKEGNVEWANHAFTTLTGYGLDEVLGKNPRILKSGIHDASFYTSLWETILSGKVWQGEIVNRRKDGTLYHEEMSITSMKDNDGESHHFIAVKQDVSERKRAEAALEQYEVELRHSQKLEAIGNLAAGIAHEINTPVQYVLSNIQFLGDAFACFKRIHALKDGSGSLETGDGTADGVDPAKAAEIAVDLDFFMNEAPLAIEQSIEGVARIKKIVYAMKEFSHPGSDKPIPTDLNSAINSSLTVCRSEWKKIAEMVTDLDPELPLVPCFSSEINQVILNLVINASHAIVDVGNPHDVLGTITVSTRQKEDWVEIRISDTGTGIPETVRDKIFNPFFTTKKVGKGTGLGLSIAHTIIEKKHGGKISYETQSGRGTTFILSLPLTPPIL